MSSAKLTFEKLGEDFSLDSKVVEALINEPCLNLTDFRHLFSSEEEVTPWAEEIRDLENARTQVSRVRQAWYSLQLHAKRRESASNTAEAADLDDPLEDKTLHDAKKEFWRRYKDSPPPEVWPADTRHSTHCCTFC